MKKKALTERSQSILAKLKSASFPEHFADSSHDTTEDEESICGKKRKTAQGIL